MKAKRKFTKKKLTAFLLASVFCFSSAGLYVQAESTEKSVEEVQQVQEEETQQDEQLKEQDSTAAQQSTQEQSTQTTETIGGGYKK